MKCTGKGGNQHDQILENLAHVAINIVRWKSVVI